MSDELDRAVGRIEGKLDLIIDGQKRSDDRMDGIDARLRKVEKQAAINGAVGGAVGGGIISIGIVLAKEKIKMLTGMGG